MSKIKKIYSKKKALADFFLPTKRNNFLPKALKPKRLVFYTLSSLAIKCIVVGTVLIFPLEAYLSPNTIYDQSRKIIALTNKLRNDLNLNGLRENQFITQAAFAKANDMFLKQYFSHTGPDGRNLENWFKENNYNYQAGGENLAIGFTDAEEVVEKWIGSPSHYSNLIDSDFKEVGIGIESGRYKNQETTIIVQLLGSQRENQDKLNFEIATSTDFKSEPNMLLKNQDTPLSEGEWDNFSISKPSSLSHYFFLKNTQPELIKDLFNISSIYYKIILFFTVLILLFNIFKEIRKQHPHIILYSIGLIGLLIALILV